VSTDESSVTGFVQIIDSLLGHLQTNQDVNTSQGSSGGSRSSPVKMENSLRHPQRQSIQSQRKERSSRMLVHGCKKIRMIHSLMYVFNVISFIDTAHFSQNFFWKLKGHLLSRLLVEGTEPTDQDMLDLVIDNNN